MERDILASDLSSVELLQLFLAINHLLLSTLNVSVLVVHFVTEHLDVRVERLKTIFELTVFSSALIVVIGFGN